MTLKDKVAIIGSAIAVVISVVSFFRDNIFAQHVLRATVVAIDVGTEKLSADVLIVNSGKHSETLYKAYFLFSEDLSTGGGSMSREFVGPLVIEAGKAVHSRLTAARPSIEDLRADGTIKNPASGVHLGVSFDSVTPRGDLPERGKIYRVTELFYIGNGVASARPRPGDHKQLIDILQ
jgi:hypothetical protein